MEDGRRMATESCSEEFEGQPFRLLRKKSRKSSCHLNFFQHCEDLTNFQLLEKSFREIGLQEVSEHIPSDQRVAASAEGKGTRRKKVKR